MADFAADYERNEEGWILFPRDIERRKEMYPQEVFDHPAKANMVLTEELIYYLTEVGDTVLDPFGGTGTTMLAALHGRPTILVDIEGRFCDLMEKVNLSWGSFFRDDPFSAADVRIIHGDCRQVLPVPCDAIITSPPYATALHTGKKEQDKILVEKHQPQMINMSSLNLSRLNPFFFGKAMVKVYQRMAESLPSGGPLAIIIKDMMRGDKRVLLSEVCIRDAQRAGFKYKEWFKWKPPGSFFVAQAKSKGGNVVEDEDIIIFRKT